MIYNNILKHKTKPTQRKTNLLLKPFVFNLVAEADCAVLWIHFPLQFSQRPLARARSAQGCFNLNQLLFFPPALGGQMERAGWCRGHPHAGEGISSFSFSPSPPVHTSLMRSCEAMLLQVFCEQRLWLKCERMQTFEWARCLSSVSAQHSS